MPRTLPIRTEALLEMLENDERAGVCLTCNAIVQDIEPDAENYRCPECGAMSVQGLENLLLVNNRLPG